MSQTLGQKIRELRIRKGLTQSELSEGLVTPSMISQIESDKANPSHQLLMQISEKLETPMEYFLIDVEIQMDKLSAYKLAQATMLKGDYAEAITLLNKLDDALLQQVPATEIKYDLAYCYKQMGNLDKANKLFETCLDTVTITNDTIQMIKNMYQLGVIAYEQKNLPVALHYLQKAHGLLQNEAGKDPLLGGEISFQLGKIYAELSEWSQAKEYFEVASDILDENCDIRQLANVNLELAKVYRNEEKYSKSMQYTQTAIALYNALDTLKKVIHAKAQTGLMFGKTGFADEGVSILQNCMTLYQNYGFQDQSSEVHASLASVFFQDRQYDKAKFHCEKALELQLPNEFAVAKIYCILAKIEMEKENYEKSKEWIEKADQIVNKEGSPGDKAQVYALYGNLYKKQGLYQEAMTFLEKMNMEVAEDLREREPMI